MKKISLKDDLLFPDGSVSMLKCRFYSVVFEDENFYKILDEHNEYIILEKSIEQIEEIKEEA